MSNFPRIALIEDESSIRDMYLMKLNASGFEAKGVEDALAGLELVKNFKPHIILLDLKMPGMSGQEVLRNLRESGDNTLVIILTNLSVSEASLDMRLLKVEKYIVKAHYTPSQVVEEVNFALKRHGLLDQSQR